jgi:predicted GNAT superfamily acetyltransferase
MTLRLRDVRENELEHVLALNNNAGPSILPMDAERARMFFAQAGYFRVAEVDGHLAGFLMALCPDAQYDSPNFGWFRREFDDFVYIDRIVIASAYRRHGLGRVFYADAQSFAEVRSPRLCCEVFLEPRDDASVLFHGTYGFREVGQQSVAPYGRVSLLAKDLCSYPWVRETYGVGGQIRLPAQPWLAGRDRPQPDLPAIRQA